MKLILLGHVLLEVALVSLFSNHLDPKDKKKIKSMAGNILIKYTHFDSETRKNKKTRANLSHVRVLIRKITRV